MSSGFNHATFGHNFCHTLAGKFTFCDYSQPRFQDDYDDVDGVSDAMFNLRKSKSSQELRSNRLSVDAAAAASAMMMTRKGSADFVTTTADGRLGKFCGRKGKLLKNYSRYWIP